jgi:RNA polymerase sigma factor (sigma-70 family)
VLLERRRVVTALRDLPERQREAIVLRYYAGLSEAEIAGSMGISRGAVKSHTARGMAALRAGLKP